MCDTSWSFNPLFFFLLFSLVRTGTLQILLFHIWTFQVWINEVLKQTLIVLPLLCFILENWYPLPMSWRTVIFQINRCDRHFNGELQLNCKTTSHITSLTSSSVEIIGIYKVSCRVTLPWHQPWLYYILIYPPLSPLPGVRRKLPFLWSFTLNMVTLELRKTCHDLKIKLFMLDVGSLTQWSNGKNVAH